MMLQVAPDGSQGGGRSLRSRPVCGGAWMRRARNGPEDDKRAPIMPRNGRLNFPFILLRRPDKGLNRLFQHEAGSRECATHLACCAQMRTPEERVGFGMREHETPHWAVEWKMSDETPPSRDEHPVRLRERQGKAVNEAQGSEEEDSVNALALQGKILRGPAEDVHAATASEIGHGRCRLDALRDPQSSSESARSDADLDPAPGRWKQCLNGEDLGLKGVRMMVIPRIVVAGVGLKGITGHGMSGRR